MHVELVGYIAQREKYLGTLYHQSTYRQTRARQGKRRVYDETDAWRASQSECAGPLGPRQFDLGVLPSAYGCPRDVGFWAAVCAFAGSVLLVPLGPGTTGWFGPGAGGISVA